MACTYSLIVYWLSKHHYLHAWESSGSQPCKWFLRVADHSGTWHLSHPMATAHSTLRHLLRLYSCGHSLAHIWLSCTWWSTTVLQARFLTPSWSSSTSPWLPKPTLCSTFMVRTTSSKWLLVKPSHLCTSSLPLCLTMSCRSTAKRLGSSWRQAEAENSIFSSSLFAASLEWSCSTIPFRAPGVCHRTGSWTLTITSKTVRSSLRCKLTTTWV